MSLSSLPTIYYISLNNRSDRRTSFIRAWHSILGFQLLRVNAIHYSDLPFSRSHFFTPKQLAQYATFLSHIKAIKLFLDSNYERAWIAEDDAYPLFDQTFFEGEMYRKIECTHGLINLAPNLSMWPRNIFPLNDVNNCMTFVNVTPPHCMHLYQINKEFGTLYYKHLIKIIMSADFPIYDVDIYKNPELSHMMWFLGSCLAGQEPGYSDIESKNIDYRNQLR